MTQGTDISRRRFMGVAGGLIGASALASGLAFYQGQDGLQENRPKVSSDDFEVEHQETDVLVIGGGYAGVFAAVKAYDAGAKVTMVVKGRMGTSGLSPFGKGVLEYKKGEENISIEQYLKDMAESSLGSNNPVFTRQMLEHSQEYVNELRSWGYFDGPLLRNCFEVPMSQRDIPIVEQVMITHLHKEQGRIAGASGFNFKQGKIIHFKAKSVILCTGSGGFKPNGFQMCDVTHDGTIMAYKIGAVVSGKEWNDGHSTRNENSAACYDVWSGQIEMNPLVMGPEVGHDLGVNINYAGYTEGAPVTIGEVDGVVPHGKKGKELGPMVPPPALAAGKDTNQYPEGPFVPKGYSMKEKMSKKKGPPPAPPSRGLLATIVDRNTVGGMPSLTAPVVGGATAGMAIHKSEGLVPVDVNGLSTIPGLYAAGDALASNLSGGIYGQVGSSVTSSSIQGGFSGKAAAKAVKDLELIDIPAQKLNETAQQILAPLNRSKGYSPSWVTQVLQGVMFPNFVLYIKKERMMQAALAYVEELREHHVPMLLADDLHSLRLAHETENMIVTAEMKLKASLMRKESRLSHYRIDYPEVDFENWQAWINIQQGNNGEMMLTKQPFDAWPNLG